MLAIYSIPWLTPILPLLPHVLLSCIGKGTWDSLLASDSYLGLLLCCCVPISRWVRYLDWGRQVAQLRPPVTASLSLKSTFSICFENSLQVYLTSFLFTFCSSQHLYTLRLKTTAGFSLLPKFEIEWALLSVPQDNLVVSLSVKYFRKPQDPLVIQLLKLPLLTLPSVLLCSLQRTWIARLFAVTRTHGCRGWQTWVCTGGCQA